jgi:hypothetical protein
MADENKGFIGGEAPRREGSINVGQNPNEDIGNAENKRDQSGDQKVTVKALKTFHKHANMQGDMVHPGDEFETHRSRAAELRANGLIEYSSEADGHSVHGEQDAKRLDEKLKRQAELSKIPENSKTTPLRNPEVKLAEAPADTGKRR